MSVGGVVDVLVVRGEEEIALFLLFLILVLVVLSVIDITITTTIIYLSLLTILFSLSLTAIPILLPITTLLLNQLHQLNPNQLPNLHPLPLYLQLTTSKSFHRIKHITQTNHTQHQ